MLTHDAVLFDERALDLVAFNGLACSRRSDSGERCEVKRSYLYFAPLSTI